MIVRVLSAAHRTALVAYPAAFRRHFGAELQAIFERRIEAARGTRRWPMVIALGAFLVGDTVASGMAERTHVFRAPSAQGHTSEAIELPRTRSRYMTSQSIAADLRLTLRQLRRAPAFAAAAILTLGLGIGAAAAIFAVAYAVLLKPLPYAEPSDLVAVWSNNTPQHEPRNPVSPANFDAFRREARSFASVEAMYSFFTNVLTSGKDKESRLSQ